MKKGEIAAIIDLNEDGALGSLTAARPIGTLPFAGRYRLIDFPLSAVARANVYSVGLFMPRSSRSVQDHVRSGEAWNLDLIQGGAFLFPYVATRDYANAELRTRYYDNYSQFLRRSGAPYTVVMGARNVANIDLAAVLAYHKLGSSSITALYKNVTPNRVRADDPLLTLSELSTASAVLNASQQSLSGHEEKLPRFMEVYLLDTVYLLDLLDQASAAGEFARLPELLRDAVLEQNANAFEYTGYLALINAVDRYYQANMRMLQERNFQSLLYSSIPILTKSKNEVPTFFAHESKVSGSLLGTGGFIEGSVARSVISRNVTVHRGAVVEDSVVMQGSKISNGSLVRHAILDKGVVIGPNLVIEGTAEAPLVLSKNQTVFKPLDQEANTHA
ncbi:glucose-1-phosphate adenylyltransferase subunit GlgD [Lacticaseibacillus yichunensis]|uniref:Glucose-1-phosphate adenylyltransferase subunit GlgD n=1 Tax=Lacticaseibacillus yichunensis TaxID=2486015 RepID=A0ABW4CSZ6_9LACO|nr:glucose-1-phosphate adenylyltransferase subunit GlgD [Lacticaseibacillus yichunensis]